MNWHEFLFEGLSGFIIACVCLLVLVVFAFVYLGKYERLRGEREDMLDKQELYRRMRAERWERVSDGVLDREAEE